MMRIRKETSGVWGEGEGVLLEIVKLPIHKRMAGAPPRLRQQWAVAAPSLRETFSSGANLIPLGYGGRGVASRLAEGMG